jgi:hypothetical protein
VYNKTYKEVRSAEFSMKKRGKKKKREGKGSYLPSYAFILMKNSKIAPFLTSRDVNGFLL